MLKIKTSEVSEKALDILFDESEIWDKISDGRLISCHLKPVPSRSWPNAMSMMIKHFSPNGKHIATTHCVKGKNNQVFHWDAHDLRVNDIRFWRK